MSHFRSGCVLLAFVCIHVYGSNGVNLFDAISKSSTKIHDTPLECNPYIKSQDGSPSDFTMSDVLSNDHFLNCSDPVSSELKAMFDSTIESEALREELVTSLGDVCNVSLSALTKVLVKDNLRAALCEEGVLSQQVISAEVSCTEVNQQSSAVTTNLLEVPSLGAISTEFANLARDCEKKCTSGSSQRYLCNMFFSLAKLISERLSSFIAPAPLPAKKVTPPVPSGGDEVSAQPSLPPPTAPTATANFSEIISQLAPSVFSLSQQELYLLATYPHESLCDAQHLTLGKVLSPEVLKNVSALPRCGSAVMKMFYIMKVATLSHLNELTEREIKLAKEGTDGFLYLLHVDADEENIIGKFEELGTVIEYVFRYRDVVSSALKISASTTETSEPTPSSAVSTPTKKTPELPSSSAVTPTPPSHAPGLTSHELSDSQISFLKDHVSSDRRFVAFLRELNSEDWVEGQSLDEYPFVPELMRALDMKSEVELEEVLRDPTLLAATGVNLEEDISPEDIDNSIAELSPVSVVEGPAEVDSSKMSPGQLVPVDSEDDNLLKIPPEESVDGPAKNEKQPPLLHPTEEENVKASGYGAFHFLGLFLVIGAVVVICYLCMHNRKKLREGVSGYMSGGNGKRRRTRQYKPLATSEA